MRAANTLVSSGASYSTNDEPARFFLDQGCPEAGNTFDNQHLPTDVRETRHVQSYVAPAELAAGRAHFRLLQSFEGEVVDRTDISIIAEVSDKTNPSNPMEVVELPLDELTPDDLPLATPGSVFYWSIGYRDVVGEPRRRVSQIRFQRLPNWSDLEIRQAKDFAQEYLSLFDI